MSIIKMNVIIPIVIALLLSIALYTMMGIGMNLKNKSTNEGYYKEVSEEDAILNKFLLFGNADSPVNNILIKNGLPETYNTLDLYGQYVEWMTFFNKLVTDEYNFFYVNQLINNYVKEQKKLNNKIPIFGPLFFRLVIDKMVKNKSSWFHKHYKALSKKERNLVDNLEVQQAVQDFLYYSKVYYFYNTLNNLINNIECQPPECTQGPGISVWDHSRWSTTPERTKLDRYINSFM